MDVFIEQLVKHKKGLWSIIAVAGIVILSVVLFLFFAIVSLSGVLGVFTGAGFLLMAGVIYCAYYGIRYTNIEYEYILTNSELDIDRILGKAKRKRMLSLNFKDIEICAPIEEAENYKQNAKKVFDFRGQGMSKEYFLITDTNDKGRICVLFEPTSKMIEEAYKFNPRKVKL